MPSTSPPRRALASRCPAETSREASASSPFARKKRENPQREAMDTSTGVVSTSSMPDFSTALGPIDELQGIARRLLADRGSIPAYCASLGSERIGRLVQEVGEGAATRSNSEIKEQNIRWHQSFPVAAGALNDNVAKFVAARSSDARKEGSSHHVVLISCILINCM